MVRFAVIGGPCVLQKRLEETGSSECANPNIPDVFRVGFGTALVEGSGQHPAANPDHALPGLAAAEHAAEGAALGVKCGHTLPVEMLPLLFRNFAQGWQCPISGDRL